MLSKRYKSTEVDCRTWLHQRPKCSTNNDIHQVVKMHKETSAKMNKWENDNLTMHDMYSYTYSIAFCCFYNINVV